jgi:hypothetical protein
MGHRDSVKPFRILFRQKRQYHVNSEVDRVYNNNIKKVQNESGKTKMNYQEDFFINDRGFTAFVTKAPQHKFK